ncbi:flagellar motor protein MotA [Acetobacter pasteurianus]|uniref:Flagellar motor protein MotA n=2 Tax=Acetobacter pasteurianus TaxID=438 RepID=A0A401WXP9_ACEPA|nr:flagellar motor stator protein MotA [Acetobacter pasteurianus]GCD54129.1 flagellar motor protein MotA [Acetobacter pasteurianus NBRC 3188]GCD60368.1 flagellar motor protein MotA [Acetobacter pasteurianus NBRC 3277]GCD63486.1 flagellar motor protein MotA [Acetobacter pasteurianus NBRC 3278]GCD70435.1 flagellar motor protein MotA [Acetobacter pasteurianus NBRC 3280]GLH28728.1 flagellar motor protein MotA [Acetobacter pasteurianus]
MLFVGGLIFALLCVFGSFAASGGALSPLIASMPFELLTILGSGLGIFVMANTKDSLKQVPSYIKLVLKGARYGKEDYMQLLNLLFRLMKLSRSKGSTELEQHYENPEDSEIFKSVPTVLNDVRTRDFICDYLRLIGMGVERDDAYLLDSAMERELKKNLSEDLHIAHCLQSLADALPALGIVAAVLGVIKTMASISKPPAVLGEMIAGAMVGTFLGVLMAYGIFAPLSAKMQELVKKDARYQDIVKTVLVAFVQGQSPEVCAEIGRKDIPEDIMPEFSELDSMLSEIKN